MRARQTYRHSGMGSCHVHVCKVPCVIHGMWGACMHAWSHVWLCGGHACIPCVVHVGGMHACKILCVVWSMWGACMHTGATLQVFGFRF